MLNQISMKCSRPKKYIIPHYLALKAGDKIQYYSHRYYLVLDNPAHECQGCVFGGNQCSLPFRDHYQCDRSLMFREIPESEYGKNVARNYDPAKSQSGLTENLPENKPQSQSESSYELLGTNSDNRIFSFDFGVKNE